MSLNNSQLVILGLGSTLLFGIGFYNKSFQQSPDTIFHKIESVYQNNHFKDKPFEAILIYDPKEKDINLFYPNQQLGYGEKTAQLVYLKPLEPFLYKLSNKEVSKINFYIQGQEVKFFLQKGTFTKAFNYKTIISSHLSLINIMKQALEHTPFQ